MRPLACLALLRLAAAESAVLALDAGSFGAAVRANPLLLVKFYAPWCGHCKQLEPEYEKAAHALHGRARLAKVDATVEVALAEQYKVEGYPTLYFFRDGQPEEYGGGRANASIVAWVEEHSGPALEELSSEEALELRLQQRGVLPFFVARGGSDMRALLASLAEERRPQGAFLFLEGPEASLRVHRGLGEVVELREAPDAGRVARFLEEEALAPFGEIGEENYAAYLARAGRGMLWVCFAPGSFQEDALKHQAAFREVAAAFPQLPVAYTNTKAYEEHVREELGCTQFPTFVLQLGNFTDEESEVDPKRYKLHLEGEISAEAITQWVHAALAGSVPEDDGLDGLDDDGMEGEEGEDADGGEDADSGEAADRPSGEL